MPRDDSDIFVTKNECKQITAGFQEDLATIKKAIVGDDMRGGMVRDISEIKNKIAKVDGDNNRGKKERAMIYVSLISAGGLVCIELIKALIPVG